MPWRRLWLDVGGLGGSLPELHPGALPSLRQVHINVVSASLELPPSWGYPGVLPDLKYLSIRVHSGQLQGSLPAEWALGFRSLHTLYVQWGALATGVGGQRLSVDDGKVAPAPAPAPASLPDWAGGFPALRTLSLIGIGFKGGLPLAWMHGSLPALEEL